VSKKLLRFLLSELKTIRVRCKNDCCGVITEFVLERLNTPELTERCPCCHAEWQTADMSGRPQNAFERLAKALALLKRIEGKVEIELELPEE